VTDGVCKECYSDCLTCNGNKNNNCLSCREDYVLRTDYVCVDTDVNITKFNKYISGRFYRWR